MTTITINGITIDPAEQRAEMISLALDSTDVVSSNYILITTTGPLVAQMRARLKNLGVILLEKVPVNSYIARYEPANIEPIRQLEGVSWVNEYLKEFKVAKELLASWQSVELKQLSRAVEVDAAPCLGMQQVDIVLHEDVDSVVVRETIAKAAGVDAESINGSSHKFRVIVDSDRLATLANLDVVRHIETADNAELCDDEALKILNVNSVHNYSPSYRGAGQVIAVCDTGFDRGNTTQVHAAFTGRVKKLYALGRPRKTNDPHGHGTHVAGSVLGDGLVQGHGPVTGTAPEAELILQSVLDANGGLGGLPKDLNQLFSGPYLDGARVHNNSWGTRNSNGRYTTSSREIDEFVWHQRDMVICFAAGNPGRDTNANGVIDLGDVQAPSTAKNCITVGASENFRATQAKKWSIGSWASRYPAEPIKSDLWADNPNGMAAFSGRGPTADGRIKPDLVAPGTSILSAHSRDALVGNFWGTSPDPSYTYMGGTSMATPLVSGCVAVLREYLIKKHNIFSPSAALIKAALINGCQELRGQYIPSEAGRTPNFNEGFGRVDLERSFGFDTILYEFHEESLELDTGDEKSYAVKVNPGNTVKVTLVWTDPPGAGLQNDLDLVLKSCGGEERHGNMPIGSTEYDRTNNVEQVWWHDFSANQLDILVRAYDIGIHPQSYALIIRVE